MGEERSPAKLKRMNQIMNGYSIWVLLIFSAIPGLTGCYYDNEEDLYPSNGNGIGEVSYQQHIQPLMQQYCATAGCHVAGNSIPPLTNYDEVAVIAANGTLNQRVLIDRTMPPAGPLSTDARTRIKIWLDAGYKNN